MALNWSLFNKTKYKQLYDKLILLNDKLTFDNYIIQSDKDYLIKYILESKLGDSAKESLFYMISRYLQINDNTNKNISVYKQLGYDHRLKRIKLKAENTLETRAEVECHKPLEFFKNILNRYNINDFKKPVKLYPYLFTAMLTLQAPLRSNFYLSAKIILINDNEDLDTLEDFNYIVIKNIDGEKPEIYYKIFKDKVSDTAYYKSKPELSLIKITDDNLIKIIITSYKKFPRVYLFETQNKTMFDNGFLLKYLKRFTKLDRLTVNIMRSIYVTTFYNDKTRSCNDKINLSHIMRHSIATANNTYYKIIKEDDEKNKTKKQALSDIVILQNENEELKKKYNDLLIEYENIKSSGNNENNNENNNEDKQYNKKRVNMLYLANKGNILKPNTISKYNISYDDENNKYY